MQVMRFNQIHILFRLLCTFTRLSDNYNLYNNTQSGYQTYIYVLIDL
jgi:hypothetical protein